jgi:hypothetical protein
MMGDRIGHPLGWIIAIGFVCAHSSGVHADPTPKEAPAAVTILSQEEANSLAGPLVQSAEKNDDIPFRFAAHVEGTSALRSSDGRFEIAVVPARSLSGDEDNPLLQQERGLPVGWLFVRGGRPATPAPLPKSWKAISPSGWIAIPLAARKLAAGQVVIELWGQGERPVVACDLLRADTVADRPIEIRLGGQLLACYGLGKYVFFIPFESSG